jgi:hypothetical protein
MKTNITSDTNIVMRTTNRLIVIAGLLAVMPVGVATVSAAVPETPLTAAGNTLEKKYAVPTPPDLTAGGVRDKSYDAYILGESAAHLSGVRGWF